MPKHCCWPVTAAGNTPGCGRRSGRSRSPRWSTANARTHDVHIRRNVPIRDLIEIVRVIIGHAQVRSIRVATGLRLRPVANRVERVIKLLSGNRRARGEIFAAIGHLAQGIVAINPIGTIGQRVLRALIGRIIVVIVRQWGSVGGTWRRGNLRQPVQIIPLFCRRHPRQAALFERNLAHQWRIGKIRIRRRIVVAIGHHLQARGVVVAEGLLEQRAAGIQRHEIRPAHELVVAVGHRKAV